MKDVAFAAYTNPGQNEPGLEATHYYDPPNLTFPYGTYIAVVTVDRDTGDVKVRRFLAVDDGYDVVRGIAARLENLGDSRQSDATAKALQRESP